MAVMTDISDNTLKLSFETRFSREIQSAHLNFFIGSGCSKPAIEVLGNIESQITALLNNDQEAEAESLLLRFIEPLLKSSERLISEDLDVVHQETLESYKNFMEAVSHLIFERRGNILPRQAVIFTTNYDLFIEKASDYSAGAYQLNDGFIRNPSLNNEYLFSSSEFFTIKKKRGYHYNYEVEIPTINLLKVHGSLSWKHKNNGIIFSCNQVSELLSKLENGKTQDFIKELSIIVPNKEKHRDTLLNQVYYDLLRIYSNELEKENSLLIAIGFSFADEHLLDITKRALRNPTLKLSIMCFSHEQAATLNETFNEFSNVECIYKQGASLPFSEVVSILEYIFIKA